MDGVDLDLAPGRIYGLLGPNGSGKTTLIRLLVGMTRATSGEAEVLGAVMPSRPTLERIGYMTQSDGIYPALTVGENARFFAALYGVTGAGAVAETLALVDLAGRDGTVAGTLSGGQRRRLSLACALIHGPEVLFLDEPTVGVDPLLRVQFWGHFRALADAGTTIVVSSHVMDEADRCDELLFVRGGPDHRPRHRSVAARGGGHVGPRGGLPPLRRRRGRVMSAHRLRALVRRVTQEIRRDRPSLALLFVAPLVITGLVTFIVRGSQTPRRDGLRRQRRWAGGCCDRRTAGRDAGRARALPLSTRRTPRPLEHRSNRARSTSRSCCPRTCWTGRRRSPCVTNGLDPSGEAAQLRVVSGALTGAIAGGVAGRLPSIEHETVYGTPSNDPIAAFAPAIVGFFVYFFVYLLTGVSFLRERTGGTLERLMATPVTRGEVVAGYTIGFCLFATVQVALLMAWALGSVQVPSIGPLPAFSIGLGIQVAGGPLVAYLVVLALAVGAVSLGIFLSTFARTELQVIQFIPLVLVPQFLLSGVLFPVSTLPDVLQPLVG